MILNMNTICIKTNNTNAINYLLENLKQMQLTDVYFSCHKFKIYNNIIINYKGNNSEFFLFTICNILCNLVTNKFENTILKRLLTHEYFYFDTIEQKQILEIAQNDSNENIKNSSRIFDILYNCFYKYLKSNKKLYLKGFLTFRAQEYINELASLIDSCVSRFLIEREYEEFISILKIYINSEISTINTVHLIYKQDNPILLDQNKKIITPDLDLSNAKFLSDISFSYCDIILNTLLNLLPSKIYIHLIDNKIDEFISTLKLIFENRICICTDCNICTIYKSQKAQKSSLK